MMFIWYIVIGLVAGWVASRIMRGRGYGLFINMIIGIIGGVLGGWLFSLLGFYSAGGIIGSLITSVLGAIVLLWFVGLVSPADKK